MPTLSRTAVLLMLWLAASAAAHAQTPAAGTVSGRVVDDRTGAALPGVQVSTPDASTVTDQDGRFAIPAVPAGTHQLTVSIVGYILVTREVSISAGQTTEVVVAVAEGTGTYREDVTVRGGAFEAREPAVAAQQVLGSAELQNLRGVMIDDPLRAVQALPGVGATDDLHGVFSVRGSGFGHLGFALNGVPTRFILHTVEAVEGGGSTAMLNGDILERVSLMSGAYPQRYGARTGALVEFDLREGSRDKRSTRIAASGSSLSVVAEGPLGRSRSGSWLVSARKSYLDLLFSQIFEDPSFTFGFEDAQAHLVRDFGPRHQLRVTGLAGRSRFQEQFDELGTNDLYQARSNGWLAALQWRYTGSERLILSQQVYGVGGRYRNLNRTGLDLNRGSGRDIGYRADVSYAVRPAVMIEASAQAGRSAESASQQRQPPGSANAVRQEEFDAARNWYGALAQVRWNLSSAIVAVSGARVDRWATVEHTDVSPWINAEWTLTPATRLLAGTGIYRQPPRFGQVVGAFGNPDIRPESARHYDIGVERTIGSTMRWRVGAYRRDERSVIDLPNSSFRMAAGRFVSPDPDTRYANVLEGTARGIELSFQRTSPAGVSGWVAYTLGKLDYTDRSTGNRFAGDFDERHNLSLYGSWRLSNRTSFASKFRLSSNFPIAGHLETRQESFGGGLLGEPVTTTAYYLSDRRNQVRLPAYSRLDLRANRTYTWDQRRLTLFVEVTNLYNRANQRAIGGDVNPRTGRVSGLTEDLFPILPSAGLLIEF